MIKLTITEHKYKSRIAREQGQRNYRLFENGKLIAAQHSDQEYAAAIVRRFDNGISFELLREVPESVPEGTELAVLETCWDDGEPIQLDANGIIDIDPVNRLLSEEKEYRPNRFEPTAEDVLAGCGLLMLLIAGFAIGQEFVR